MSDAVSSSNCEKMHLIIFGDKEKDIDGLVQKTKKNTEDIQDLKDHNLEEKNLIEKTIEKAVYNAIKNNNKKFVDKVKAFGPYFATLGAVLVAVLK